MSREIKFRAWESKEKRWAAHRIMPVLKGIIERLTLKDCLPISGRLIIEQYTGLTDKNGKEIYEGDIVRLYGRFISAISWQDGYCGFRWYNNSGDGYCSLSKDNEEYYEVIGNIHENPELLGVENE